MADFQAGILTECRDHAYYVVVHLKDEADEEIKNIIKKFPELLKEVGKIDEKAGLECVIGIGFNKTKKWFPDKKFPHAMIEFRGKSGTGGSIPATGGDILLHIKCNRVDLCYELGNRFFKSIPKELVKDVEETFGFVYMKANFGKDLTGFEDGPANPSKEEERKEAAIIGKDDPIHEGGSYCLLQKWVHNLDKFNSVPVSEQESIIGRTKGNDSKKIKPKPANAHTTRTDVKENDKELKTVRQSTPFGGIKEHGLVFISYASTPHKFERQLSRMVGEDPKEGPSDRILEFSKPVTGNYFFIPSVRVMSNL